MRRAAGPGAEFNQGRMTVIFPTCGRVVFRSLDDPDNAPMPPSRPFCA